MQKIILNNLYESTTPPNNTNVLWVVKDKGTGDIKAIHRFKSGNWEPYLVSVDYMKPND